MMIRTYLDSGVLTAAVRGTEDLAAAALALLSDPAAPPRAARMCWRRESVRVIRPPSAMPATARKGYNEPGETRVTGKEKPGMSKPPDQDDRAE